MLEKKQQNRMGKLLWFAVVVWFSSSLLSQALFIGFYGIPYDAIELLSGLGPIYYLIVIVEVLMWILLAGLTVGKVSRRINVKLLNRLPTLGK